MDTRWPPLGALVVICVGAFWSSPGVEAAPYWGEPFAFSQPDGTTVPVRVWGDEFYQRVDDPDGYTLVRDPRTGWICYAELSGDGTEFISTGRVYDPHAPVDAVYPGLTSPKTKPLQALPLKKKLRLLPESIRRKALARRKALFSTDQPASDPGLIESPAPASASATPERILGLTILIEFPDVEGAVSRQAVEAFLNEPGYSDNGNNGSVRDFFHDVSNGLVEYTNVVTDYYTAQHEKAYYTDETTPANRPRELILEALQELDQKGFNFATLTANSSGRLRAVNVLYAGRIENAWGKGLWPHSGSIGSKSFLADGVRVTSYQMSDLGDMPRLGTFCHENGHMLFNWADLYDYDYDSQGVGLYCLMAAGSGGSNPMPPNPYFRWLQGWEQIVDITDATRGTMFEHQPNSFQTFRYSQPAHPGEFFLIESRLKQGRFANSPDEGLLIWHVDQDGDNDWQDMNAVRHYMVSVEQADGFFQLEKSGDLGGNTGYKGDLFRTGYKDRFDDRTVPDAKWWNGDDSGLALCQVSDVGSPMTFRLGWGHMPLAHWGLNGDLIDDVSGRTAVMLGNGVASGVWSDDSPVHDTGGKAAGLSLDGVQDLLDLGYPGLTDDCLTVACWIKPGRAAEQVVLGQWSEDASGRGWLVLLHADGRVAFEIGSGANYTAVVSAYPMARVDHWMHIACAFERGTARIFANGWPVAGLSSINQHVYQASTPLFAGGGPAGPPYAGLIDDVYLFSEPMQDDWVRGLPGLASKDRRLIGRWPLDETQDTTAADRSANGHPGQLADGMSFNSNSVQGQLGNALRLDGVNDTVTIKGLNLRSAEATLTAWVYLDGTQKVSPGIVFSHGEQTTAGLSVSYFRGHAALSYTWATLYATTPTGLILDGNTWTFVALAVTPDLATVCTFDGSTWSSFVNKAPHPLQTFPGEFYIGSDRPLKQFLKGAVDDIRFYNYALDQDQIRQVSQGGPAAVPLPEGGDWTAPVNTALQWVSGLDGWMQDVYFGTNYCAVVSAGPDQPEYLGRQANTTLQPVLQPGQDYFWRVDQVDGSGSIIPGDIWTFRTHGSITRQVWMGISGTEISSLTGSNDYPDSPDCSEQAYQFEAPRGAGGNYGARLSGYLAPRTSGMYTFWISGDDNAQLWLGLDGSQASARMIAVLDGPTGFREWDATASQQSVPIPLVAGQLYYIMALHKEGKGDDHLSVAWQGPDSPDRSVIDGAYLYPIQAPPSRPR